MFRIRQALISDAHVIGDLLVRSARFAYAEIASPEYLASLDPAVKAEEYERLLPTQSARLAVFVAHEDNVPLGFAEIELKHTELPEQAGSDRLGLLQRMFFVPESFGRGLGPILHETVIQEFARWECSSAELTYVQGNNRARAFYLKHGWCETGEIRPFDDHGRTLNDIVMRRPIP